MSAKPKETTQEPATGYLHVSVRPFPSLVFIFPMLAAYEGAILALGADAVHNGAAVWLQNVLNALGVGNYVLLPVLTCAILLGWHYVKRLPWKFTPLVLLGMVVESVLWAAVLWGMFWAWTGLVGGTSTSAFDVAHLFGFMGAGIYEELLFRVFLLTGIAAIVRQAGAPQRASLTTGILVSSVLFAIAHYNIVVSGGLPFSWAGISFHTLCGIYLGTLFTSRGFGITAGTHALYNVLVLLLKT